MVKPQGEGRAAAPPPRPLFVSAPPPRPCFPGPRPRPPSGQPAREESLVEEHSAVVEVRHRRLRLRPVRSPAWPGLPVCAPACPPASSSLPFSLSGGGGASETSQRSARSVAGPLPSAGRPPPPATEAGRAREASEPGSRRGRAGSPSGRGGRAGRGPRGVGGGDARRGPGRGGCRAWEWTGQALEPRSGGRSGLGSGQGWRGAGGGQG